MAAGSRPEALILTTGNIRLQGKEKAKFVNDKIQNGRAFNCYNYNRYITVEVNEYSKGKQGKGPRHFSIPSTLLAIALVQAHERSGLSWHHFDGFAFVSLSGSFSPILALLISDKY